MGGVSQQLEQFAASAEPLVLQLRDTTPAERSAAHSWVEKHEEASVRAWEHVSVTIDGERVLQVTKPDGWQPAVPKVAAPTPQRPANRPRASAAPPTAAPSVCRGSTTVAVGENVHDRLSEFAVSAFERMEVIGTTPADRSATHGWVEEHTDAAIRSWGHESANVNGERVLILTKPAGTPAPAGAGSAALPAKKKKKKKRKGPASTEGLTEAELKRREWQKQKQQEALERQKKGLPRVMPSKRRRANDPRRKGHNNDKKEPDGPPDGPPSGYTEGVSEGDGFMQPGAWRAPSS
jgi:hypothetical protein